jgi:anthranilate phosphoribosyltransferase
MARLGTRRTFVVSGEDGLGDVTLAGVTHVTEVAGGELREFTWRPEDFGLQRTSLDSLAIDGPAASAAIIRGILAGERGAPRDIVVLNAAAGLVAAGKMSDLRTAAGAAGDAIDRGIARTLLERLAERSFAAA